MAILAAPLAAGPAEKEARRGIELFQSGRIDEAIEAFRQAAELDPASATHQFNLGSANARAGKNEQAVDALGRSIEYPGEQSKADAFYNRGNTKARMAEPAGGPPADPNETIEMLRGAASDYRQAIIADPSRIDAKHNYELTREKIRQIEAQMQQQQDQESENDEGEENEQDDSDGEGEQQNEEQEAESGADQSENQQEQDRQQGEDESDSEQSEGEPSPDLGEATPTPTPRPASEQEPASPNEAEEEKPLTEEQMNALRMLNSLAEDNPEQFKRLFQMRTRTLPPRSKKDW